MLEKKLIFLKKQREKLPINNVNINLEVNIAQALL